MKSLTEFSIKSVLYNYRMENNLTQEELAVKLGMSKSAVSRYEKGTRTPHPIYVRHILEILNTKL